MAAERHPETAVGIAVCVVLVVLGQLQIAKGLSEADLSHDCLRSCEWPPKPRSCRYEFKLEWLFSMSKACFNCPSNLTDCYRPHCLAIDGAPRAVATANRQFPGPLIEVCEHDTVIVKVHNMLINAEGVTIHWHGPHQRGTPYMDGTALITQCPIPFGSSFTYQINADTPGTHWWHSHSGLQRADGLLGPFVVRQAPPDDPHSGRYDHDLPEHIVIVQDWIDEMSLNRYVGNHFSTLSESPDSVLINGRGQKVDFFDPATNKTVRTPRESFRVRQGSRYRFRTISNAILDCPIEISVDGHDLTMIASDGSPFEPVLVSRYVLYGGERYDFVLDANQPIGKYWMRVRAVGFCTYAYVDALAEVIYDGAADSDEPSLPEGATPDRKGVILNPVNRPSSETVKNVNQLVAIGTAETLDTVDKTVYLGLDFENITNPIYNDPEYYPTESKTLTAQMNRVSFKHTAVPPLTQLSDISEYELCSVESTEAMRGHCKKEYCECTQVVEIEFGETVELVIVDEGKPFEGTHPMHIHGYNFQVVAMGKVGESTTVEEVRRLDQTGGIVRNFVNAPRKDTVVVPDGGYTIVRFVADNPGWWFFHCHLEFHNTIGMAVVLRVGDEGDLPAKPTDFPRCGNWYPHGEVTATPSPDPSGGAGLLSVNSPLVMLVSLLGYALVCFM